ncbi:MAG: hypothetical protein QXV21_05175 [Candidatus Bathyarchaeia archaeon]
MSESQLTRNLIAEMITLAAARTSTIIEIVSETLLTKSGMCKPVGFGHAKNDECDKED